MVGIKNLEALSVDDGRTRFVIFFLGDPHLLESGEGSKDRSTNPDRVFSLWRSDDLDLHGRWSKSNQFLVHSFSNTREHSGSSGKNNVSVQVLSDINIAFHDGVVSGFMNSSRFHTKERWLEKSFWASESFVTNGDNLSVRKFIRFLQSGRRSSGLHFLFKVKSNISEFLLDVTNNFTFSSGGERVTTFSKDFHHVISQITSSKIQSEDSMRKSITFINWDGMGNTITRIQNNTGGSSRCIQGKNSLDSNVHSWSVESFKHNLSHLFSVGFWVKRSFGQKNRVFFRSNTEFVVESMMPDFFHIIPVGNNTVFNWVFQGKDTSFGLSFITDIGIFLSHTDHNTGMSWATNNRWENSTWSIISSETGFAHSGTVINNKGLNFVVTHFLSNRPPC